MGWFWSSTPSPATPSQAGETLSTSASSSSSPSSSSQSSSQSIPQQHQPADSLAASNPSIADNGSQDGDPELHKFMAMLQGSDSGSGSGSGSGLSRDDDKPSASSAQASKPSKLAAWKAAWSSSSSAQEDAPSSSLSLKEEYVPRERSLAEAVLPVQMSCRQAFDLAWACQSPAGQWRAVYRHGAVQQCSELWDDFWFCMRVKGYGEGPLKEEAVREHYRKKEMDKYYKPDTPSSEDVWRSRTVDEVLAPGAVFQNSFKAVLKKAEASPAATMATTTAAVDDGRDDASQILADAERRQRIRQQMGYSN